MTTTLFTTNSIVKDPTNKAAIYRVLGYDEVNNQFRVVRASKDGSIHGLVKNIEGSWIDAKSISKWDLIGTFDQATQESQKQTSKALVVHKTSTNGKQAQSNKVQNNLSATKNLSASTIRSMRAAAVFHRSIATGLEEVLKEV